MRVNGSLLAKSINKRVSLIGTVEQVLSDNKSFSLKASDGVDVTIQLQKPITSHLSGLVEVHGIANGTSSISCDYYITFPPELAKTYDALLDNDAVNLGFRVSSAWQ